MRASGASRMIVSSQQLAPKALQPGVRHGGENPNREVQLRGNQGITRGDEGDRTRQRGIPADGAREHADGAGARRREVKPQPKAPAKAARKPAAKAKPAGKAA